jgi:GT2 family glycosyltransferase
MKKNNIPLVSIIILNFNGFKDTEKCLKSLLKTKYKNFEVLLIDNGSNKNEALKIETLFNSGKIRIYRLEKNLGFTGGNNWGLKKARGKYVALLNNDTVVEPNWLDPLVEELERNKKTAVVQPKIKLMFKRDYFDYAGAAGGYIDKYGYPFTRGRIFGTFEKDVGQYDQRCRIFWASGAACLIRKSVINKVGGLFSENLFNYMEEIDFCWRVWNRGFQVFFIPESVVYHKVAGISNANLFKKRFWEHRNNLFILARNLDRSKLLFILPTRFILEIVSYINYLYRRQYKFILSLLAAHLDFAFKFLKTRYKRNRLPNRKDLPIYPGSIAFDYFIRKIRYFHSLNWSVKGNVVYVLYDTKESGGSKTVVKHIKEFKKKGYTARLYVIFRKDIRWIPKDIKVHSAASLFLDKKQDVLVATFWPTAYIVFLLRSKAKFYFVQGWEEDFHKTSVLRLMARSSYKLPMKKIVTSDYLYKKVLQVAGCGSFLYKIKHSVLDLFFLNSNPKFKKNVFNKLKQIEILSVVSRYIRPKGINLLVKAIRKLKESNPSYKFTLVSKETKRYSKEFDNFISDPSKKMLKKLYEKADYFLATSRTEGFFIPGLEAMATGTVFITTNSGGVLDYAKDGYNAVILEKLDDLWEKRIIEKIESNPILKEKLIRNGYKTAKQYTNDKIIDELERIYFPNQL